MIRKTVLLLQRLNGQDRNPILVLRNGEEAIGSVGVA
jgi:hypothetical protein